MHTCGSEGVFSTPLALLFRKSMFGVYFNEEPSEERLAAFGARFSGVMGDV